MRRRPPTCLLLAALGATVAGHAAATTLAYVANFDDDTVSIVDVDRNAVVRTVAAGNGPTGLAVHPFRPIVYVGDAAVAPGSLSVISTDTRTVVDRVSLPAFGELKVHPGGTRLYAASFPTDSLLVIDTATTAITATIPVGDFPEGVAVHPDGTRVYVANAIAGTLSVIDALTNAVIMTIPVGRNPSEMAMNAAGTRLYVSNAGADTVSVIDTATNTVVATVEVGDAPAGLALHPDGAWLYVAVNTDARLVVVDTVINSVVGSVPTGGSSGDDAPVGVAVRADGTRAYVVNSGSNTLVAIDTVTLRQVATVPVGKYPTSLVLVERSPIEIVSARVRRVRGRIRNNGSFTVAGRFEAVGLEDLDTADGLVVELRAGLSVSARRAWAPGDCMRHDNRLDCRSADGLFAGVFRVTPTATRFALRIGGLALQGPFAAPVSLTLAHGGTPVRAGGIEAAACTASIPGLRCQTF